MPIKLYTVNRIAAAILLLLASSTVHAQTDAFDVVESFRCQFDDGDSVGRHFVEEREESTEGDRFTGDWVVDSIDRSAATARIIDSVLSGDALVVPGPHGISFVETTPYGGVSVLTDPRLHRLAG